MTSGMVAGLVLFMLGMVIWARAEYQKRERARMNREWCRRQEAWYQAMLAEARGPEPARLIDMLGRGERMTITGHARQGWG